MRFLQFFNVKLLVYNVVSNGIGTLQVIQLLVLVDFIFLVFICISNVSLVTAIVWICNAQLHFSVPRLFANFFLMFQEMGLLEIKHGLLQLAETLDFLHNNAHLAHRAISPEVITILLFIVFCLFLFYY